ncbi:MAG: type II toxin-antitoxin system RelE/ParE family toxin [Clostridiales Family XIII bacterium]|jgi:plasmid stabilization system protein ParE|nr:type II toxin-antitoxin system RelE/ParE family toxin [Clostridiales Family XIII bacterium]
MAKKYKVVINSQADHAMSAHIRFLARASAPAAGRLKKTLVAKLRTLKDNPYAYPVFESKTTLRDYRKIVIGRYIILYEISERDRTVYVKFIWDSRMDNAL